MPSFYRCIFEHPKKNDKFNKEYVSNDYVTWLEELDSAGLPVCGHCKKRKLYLATVYQHNVSQNGCLKRQSFCFYCGKAWQRKFPGKNSLKSLLKAIPKRNQRHSTLARQPDEPQSVPQGQ